MSLIAAFALVSGLGYLFPCASWPRVPCFPAWWQSHVPFDYAGTSLLAFALGATAWKPLNLVCSRDKAIDRIIEEDKDAFEILLKKAQDNANTVAVTMSNGKVYVGYVLHTFNPAFPTRFIKILPTKSGYRDDLDKTYHFTVFYSEALDQIDLDFEQNYNDFLDVEHQLKDFTDKKGDKTKAEKKKIDKLEAERQKLEDILDQIALEADAFGIVLPVSEIRSLNIFSEYIHSKYFSSPAEHANET